MAVCSNKTKRENTGKNKTLKEGLHGTMIMAGVEGKKLKNCCVVEDIEHQQKIRENDGIIENEGYSSPMSKTR